MSAKQLVGEPELLSSKPVDMTWRDYLVELLHLGAEIEHALMVQYLYTAYSLGGEQVPSEHRAGVHRWQQIILTIAREEMGHLLTLQNALRLLGGPICFDRNSYPWSSPYYPFPFRLAPFGMDTLTHFIYAEMPPADQMPTNAAEWQIRIYDRVRDRIEGEGQNKIHHHVGKLYEQVLGLIKDPKRVPESAFLGETYPLQASWDEWGRGYRPDPKAASVPGTPAGPVNESHNSRSARVIVAKLASRTEAIAALIDVASQGEAPHIRGASRDGEEASHFERFAQIYREYEPVHERFSPARQVAYNPTTIRLPRPAGITSDIDSTTYIESEQTRGWASLFNLRYRILLAYLTQSYSLSMSGEPGVSGVRGGALHRAFGEMYNIKAIANLLMRMPLTDDPSDPRRAGPPFGMPRFLSLPVSETDCWRLHRDLLSASRKLSKRLEPEAQGNEKDYLMTLKNLDEQTSNWIDQVLRGRRETGSQPV